MSKISEKTHSQWIYGSATPFAEPSWARGGPSPHYTDSHRRLRKAMHDWVEVNVILFVQEYEEAGVSSPELYKKAATDGLLMAFAAGSRIPEEWRGGFPIIGGVKPEEWDGFHDVIMHVEVGRAGGVSLQNSLFGSIILPTPALQKFGSPELKRWTLRDVRGGRQTFRSGCHRAQRGL
jgi:hypothetical protein